MTINGKGFIASGNITDAGFFGGFQTCKAKAGTALYAGMPMKFGTGSDAGLLIPCPDGGLDSPASIVGVAVGFFWFDTSGQLREGLSVGSSQTSAAGSYEGLTFTAGSGVGVKIRIDGASLYEVKAVSTLAITEAMRGRYVRVVGADTDARIDVMDGEGTPAAVAVGDAVGVIVDVVRGEKPQVYGNTASAAFNDWGMAGNTVLIKLVNTVY